MNTNPHYLQVILDKNATIIKFKCTLRNSDIKPEDVLGKNWFDLFIEDIDKEKVMKVFNGLLSNKTKKWKSFENDIVIKNQHKFIDFDNELSIKDGELLLFSTGVEHMDNL